MEREYKRPVVYASKNRRKNAGRQKTLPYFKKLFIQSFVSLLVFALIYGVNFFDNSFCRFVQNEVRYTIDYTPEFDELYFSSKEVIKYLMDSFENGRAYVDEVIFGAHQKSNEENAEGTGTDIKEVITEPKAPGQDSPDTI